MCTASHWTNGQDLLGRGGEAELGLTIRVAGNRGHGRGAPPCREVYKEAIQHCLAKPGRIRRAVGGTT